MDFERMYNDDDENNDVYNDGYDDDFDEGPSGDYVGYINSQEIISVIHADLSHKKMKIKLLNKATKIASNSWFWMFKSEENKIKSIINVYWNLIEMTGLE